MWLVRLMDRVISFMVMLILIMLLLNRLNSLKFSEVVVVIRNDSSSVF